MTTRALPVTSVVRQAQHREIVVIAYAPLNTALDGTYRAIQVTAASPGKDHLEVRTRRGYLAN